MTRPRYSDFGLYRRLARHTRSSWSYIAALFVVDLFATPRALLTPLALKIVRNRGRVGDSPRCWHCSAAVAIIELGVNEQGAEGARR